MLEKISIQGPATFVDEVVLDNLPDHDIQCYNESFYV